MNVNVHIINRANSKRCHIIWLELLNSCSVWYAVPVSLYITDPINNFYLRYIFTKLRPQPWVEMGLRCLRDVHRKSGRIFFAKGYGEIMVLKSAMIIIPVIVFEFKNPELGG